MSPLRVLAVDDERRALRRLRRLLQSIPQVEHIGEASSRAEAISAIDALRPDVVLLDIALREGDGFDVVDALTTRTSPPSVIVVTAFDCYAVRAFESAVADYLLKPVGRDRLSDALERARRRIVAADAEKRLAEMREVVRNLRAHGAEWNGVGYETEFWLRGADGLRRVPVESIDCVSSEDDYVAIHTAWGSHLMRTSIRRFEGRVKPGQFVRVHRAWLVRRSAISEIRTPRGGGSEIVLRSGRRIPVGKLYLKQLKSGLRDGSAPRGQAPSPDRRVFENTIA